jgi:hypothetical protein
MSFNVPLPDADYDALPVGFYLGVSDGVEAMGFPNRSLQKLSRDLQNDLELAVLGSPGPSAGYSEFYAGLSYIDSGVVETAAITLIGVCKTPETGIIAPLRPSFIGNQSGGQASLDDPLRLSTGVQLYALSDTQMTFSACRITGPGTGSTNITSSNWILTVPNVSDFSCYCARADDTRQNLHDLTRSLSNTSSVAAGRTRLRSPGNLRVGSAANSNVGRAHIGFWLVASRWLSDSEVATAHARLQTYFASKGITI